MGAKRIKTKQDAINLVSEQYGRHQGKWLTIEATEKYQARVRLLGTTSCEMKGKKYELMLELMSEYGITQLEAVNILSGFHTADYVNKYFRIQNRIPLDISEKNSGKTENEQE